MNRRDFLKMMGIGTAGTGLGYLIREKIQAPLEYLIPYVVPAEDIVPGNATWYSSLCGECPAGCGTIVKVMDGRVKKIEGNPSHPVNKGRLCSRGQASPQSLYNPDRIKNPLRRLGNNRNGIFVETTWDDAFSILGKNLKDLSKNGEADHFYLLSSLQRGHLNVLIKDFMEAYGSPNYYQWELFHHKNLSFANQVSMGIHALPFYDLEKTKYLLSFGADFLSTWLSPVNLSDAFGKMRQEGKGERGYHVHVEPRLSQTGANADEWIPLRPGTEGILALGLARYILERGYFKSSEKGAWKSLLEKYSLKTTAEITEISEQKIMKIATRFAETRPSLALGGETVASCENGISSLIAINVLNYLAGNIGIEGGVIPNPEEFVSCQMDVKKSFFDVLRARNKETQIKTLILLNTNPVFTTPQSFKLENLLTEIPLIVSLSSFMDETTVIADLVLPIHTPLEDWGDDFPDPSTGFPLATIKQPAVTPVLNSLSAGDIFLSLSKEIGIGEKFKSMNYADFLKDSWKELYARRKGMSDNSLTFDQFWIDLLARGGWWDPAVFHRKGIKMTPNQVKSYLRDRPSLFEGEKEKFPFYLVLYPHSHYFDGRGANLPWLQELPDPITKVVWDSWVEMNPNAAFKLGLKEGDMVTVESPSGKIDVPLYLYPGIRPDTVAIPIGQGHRFFGRYAENRGANPLEVLPDRSDPNTGTFLLNSTRVFVCRSLKSGQLVKLAGTEKELGREIIKTKSIQGFKKEVF
ncbi:MAG: molybdopterin-containing oxidoreductase family protein [Nitrospiria bacterium]